MKATKTTLFVIARAGSRNCYYAGVSVRKDGVTKDLIETSNKEQALEVTKAMGQSMCLTLSTQYGFPADLRPASGKTFDPAKLILEKEHKGATIKVYKTRPQNFCYTLTSPDIDDNAANFVSADSALRAAIASLDEETEAA